MKQHHPEDPQRILLVEDDAFLRDVVADILAEAGFVTSQAGCAGEALGLLESQSDIAEEIAALVTDVDMPGEIDGIALAARVNETWPKIGVVITSGAHRGGALALRPPALFLAKPFRAERLVAAIRSVIEPGEANCESVSRRNQLRLTA
jgi:DNA-binding NtrC family response regulator